MAKSAPLLASFNAGEWSPLPFPSESHERALDRLTLIAQELDEAAGRALHLPKGESGAPATIPAVPARAGHLLGFDLAGAPVAIAGAAPSLLVSSFAAALLDDGDAATAQATLGAGAAGAAVFQAASAVAAQDALHANGADIASAATLNLDAATGDQVDVTGTATITAITLGAGRMRAVRFTGALILTHGASLVLPGAANIATAAGDVAVFRGYAGGVVQCVAYQRATTPPVTVATQAEMEAAVSNAAVVSPLAMKWHPGVAKAWVKFSVVAGTPVIDRAFNVSSITDNGVGDFTINFATPFSDSNYCLVGNGRSSTAGAFLAVVENFDTPMRTTTSVRIYALKITGGGTITTDDPPIASVVVFGDI